MSSHSCARVLVCVGPQCNRNNGGRQLLSDLQRLVEAHFASQHQETKITIITRECLRLCSNKPVMRAEPCGDIYDADQLETLLRDLSLTIDEAQTGSTPETSPPDHAPR